MTQEPIAVVSISGGKDSHATALVAIERYGRSRVRLVMADTGHEHPLTMEFVRDYLPDALGIPIEIVRADFTAKIEGKRQFIAKNWEYMGVPLARVDRALEILRPTGNPYLDLCMWKGRFPSRKAQFCTQFLKQDVLDAFMLALAEEIRAPLESWQGVRRDESASRANALDYEPPCLDRPWAIVRPIAGWTAQQTVDCVLSRQQRLNPLYSLGMKRVGCMPCVNCGKDELLEISRRWTEEISRVREWEFIVANASKRGAATFFSDPDKQNDGIARAPSEYARIDSVVEWAKTSHGGKQYDLEKFMPAAACSSLYGLCE